MSKSQKVRFKKNPVSQKTCQKLRISSLGNTNTKGKKLSYESKKKISNALKGIKKSKKHAINISKGLTGKSLSFEHRQSISKSNKGRIVWNKGIKLTDDIRRRYVKVYEVLKDDQIIILRGDEQIKKWCKENNVILHDFHICLKTKKRCNGYLFNCIGRNK